MQAGKPVRYIRPLLFFLFFVSGFSGLVYQVVWVRMAYASFGIITPVLSVVLSVFMLGLSLGSVAGGKWIPRLTARTGFSGAVFYALAEFLIGFGAFAVPQLFAAGEHLLLSSGAMDSFGYLALSACVLALSILPWCFFMGTTFPFMMAYVREIEANDKQSFSFLYTANVLGAMSGTFLTAVVFVELFGFHHTLRLAAAGNFCIALISLWLGSKQSQARKVGNQPVSNDANSATPAPPRFTRWILFATGFCAMAMEVVWTRAFTPVLKTQVYSFALIVFTYLGATFAGSLWYRHQVKRHSPWPVPRLMGILIVAVFLPIVAGDPRWVDMDWSATIYFRSAIFTLASICPFCAALGYLTPSLVDGYAAGDPTRAGKAYAINVLGCILGPLFASYVLLPHMGERLALILLGLPFFIFYFADWKSLPMPYRLFSGLAALVVAFYSVCMAYAFQDFVARISVRTQIRRDYAASVISREADDGEKTLLVNGMGMTRLLPCTKYMADLPMAFHQGKPESILVICFGMGTTYRSALSWGVDTTVVELVPSVPKSFGFYHADAAEVLRNSQGRIVIDDGRRFLKRTRDKYDIIIIDPPPPVQAAGSSLLFSTEMYDLIKQHLNPHGIVQVWYPGDPDPVILQAAARSAVASFPYVRSFRSINGWGLHILASKDPIEQRTPAQLVAQMPDAAKKDLLEWSLSQNLSTDYGIVLSREINMDAILNPNPEIQIRDDDPLNEYFLLRLAKIL